MLVSQRMGCKPELSISLLFGVFLNQIIKTSSYSKSGKKKEAQLAWEDVKKEDLEVID